MYSIADIGKIKKQIKWIVSQLKCLEEKGCLCFGFETSLNYDENTGELTSNYVDDSSRTTPLNIPRNTSDLNNDGENGTEPFITVNDIPDVPEYTLSPISGTNDVQLLKDNNVVSTINLTPYLDDTNLSRLINGTLDNVTGIATFERDDNSTFTVDFSALIDVQPQNTSDLNNDGEDGTSPFVTQNEIQDVIREDICYEGSENTTFLAQTGFFDVNSSLVPGVGQHLFIQQFTYQGTTYSNSTHPDWFPDPNNGSLNVIQNNNPNAAVWINTGNLFGKDFCSFLSQMVNIVENFSGNPQDRSKWLHIANNVYFPNNDPNFQPNTSDTFSWRRVTSSTGAFAGQAGRNFNAVTNNINAGNCTFERLSGLRETTRDFNGNETIVYKDENDNVITNVSETNCFPEYSIDIQNNQIILFADGSQIASKDLSIYLDDTNLARITSGVLNDTSGIATFTRDDNTTFTVDFSTLLGNNVQSLNDLTDVVVENQSLYMRTSDPDGNETRGNNNIVIGNAGVDGVGNDNILIGNQAGNGVGNDGGNNNDRNVLIGVKAGSDLAGGDNNVMIGFEAGLTNRFGDRNILIGSQVDTDSFSDDDKLNIGNIIKGDLTTNIVELEKLQLTQLNAGNVNDQVLTIDTSGNVRQVTFPSASGPFAFKQNGSGYYEIQVPFGGTNIFIEIGIYRHGLGLTRYRVAGYLNNPNGWVQTYVTKISQNAAAEETVTLTDNGSAGDFRIYIGDNGTTGRNITTLFITEALQSGISGASSGIGSLNIFPVSIQSTITGVVKGTF